MFNQSAICVLFNTTGSSRNDTENIHVRPVSEDELLITYTPNPNEQGKTDNFLIKETAKLAGIFIF